MTVVTPQHAPRPSAAIAWLKVVLAACMLVFLPIALLGLAICAGLGGGSVSSLHWQAQSVRVVEKERQIVCLTIVTAWRADPRPWASPVWKGGSDRLFISVVTPSGVRNYQLDWIGRKKIDVAAIGDELCILADGRAAVRIGDDDVPLWPLADDKPSVAGPAGGIAAGIAPPYVQRAYVEASELDEPIVVPCPLNDLTLAISSETRQGFRIAIVEGATDGIGAGHGDGHRTLGLVLDSEDELARERRRPEDESPIR